LVEGVMCGEMVAWGYGFGRQPYSLFLECTVQASWWWLVRW
jgi:hypothetical protein